MKGQIFMRALCERKEGEKSKPGEPIRFKASTEGIKRDGKDLDAKKWNLENYRKNPVFLWVHDYFGRYLPLGRSDVLIEGQEMVADVTFDQSDDFARQVEGKYLNGFLNAVSVGWNDVIRCGECGHLLNWWETWGVEVYRKKCPNCDVELRKDNIQVEYDLLDISAVPVPGDPDALMEREFRAMREMLSGERETQSGEDPWERVAAEMVGIFVPGSDETVDEDARLKRYRALLPRYRKLGKTPPEFMPAADVRALSEAELAGLFLEGEWEAAQGRAGAVLNSRNRQDLEQAVTLIQGVLSRAKKEEASAEDEEGAEDDERAMHDALQMLNIRMNLL